MGNALAIASADLNTLENNMMLLNQNINVVASDLVHINGQISGFNTDVKEVKEKVLSLEEEIRNMMYEIKGSTLVSNAQNDKLINQNELNKKFGMFDTTRNIAKSFIFNIISNKISKNMVNSTYKELLSSSPNYYLTYVMNALCGWFLNNKEYANQNLSKAMSLNEKKTCLFMAVLMLKLNRTKAALRWVKRYLKLNVPTSVDSDFVILLDTLANVGFDPKTNDEIVKNIIDWSATLNTNKDLYNACINRWNEFLIIDNDNEINDFPILKMYAANYDSIKNKVYTARSYENILDKFNNLFKNNSNTLSLNVIVDRIVDSYDENELKYRKAILKDDCVINNNGNTRKADEEFLEKSMMYNTTNDLYTLLTDTILYNDNISSSTKKMSVSLIKQPILEALKTKTEITNSNINAVIDINGFSFESANGENEKEIIEKYSSNNNSILGNTLKNYSFIGYKSIISIIILLLGIILLFIQLFVGIIGTIGGICLLLYFLLSIGSDRKRIITDNNNVVNSQIDSIEDAICEVVDAYFEIVESKQKYDEIINYINQFNTNNYVESGDNNG